MEAPVEFKVIVVGDGIAGKTALLIRYSTRKELPAELPSVAASFVSTERVGNREVTLSVWDTAGQEEYDTLRKMMYANAGVVILCFSIAHSESLESVRTKWHPEVHHLLPKVPLVLVGTNDAQRTASSVTEKQGRDLAHKLKAASYVECSAHTGYNVEKVFAEAAKAALKH